MIETEMNLVTSCFPLYNVSLWLYLLLVCLSHAEVLFAYNNYINF